MTRSVIVNESLRRYLDRCAETGKLSHGLIFGQPSSEKKDYVIHFAETSNDSVCIKEPEEEGKQTADCTEAIGHQAVAHHWLSATRMVPGSFFVLGLFVVHNEDIFTANACTDPLKKALRTCSKTLKKVKYNVAQGLPQYFDDYLVLFYSSTTRTPVCKSYSIKADKFSPVEWKFVKSSVDWHLIESSYEFDDVFPLTQTAEGINLENNFSLALENITLCVENSEIFIQNEKVDNEMILETYLRNKKGKAEEHGPLKANIFLRELISHAEPPKLVKFEGNIKFQGTVLSRIWCHPKNSFKEIEAFIRNDILRSIAARTQIYLDSLSSATSSKETLVSEPPRRVFFMVSEYGGIQCCEYLFRNETPEVACEQAKEILDLDIDPEDVLMDSEGVPDFEESISGIIIPNTIKGKKTFNEITWYMYVIGIVVALMVVIASVALHFLLR